MSEADSSEAEDDEEDGANVVDLTPTEEEVEIGTELVETVGFRQEPTVARTEGDAEADAMELLDDSENEGLEMDAEETLDVADAMVYLDAADAMV